MTQSECYGCVESFSLPVGLWGKLSAGDVVQCKSTTHCYEEFLHKLSAIGVERPRRNTVFWDPVLENGTSYCGGVDSCCRYHAS